MKKRKRAENKNTMSMRRKIMAAAMPCVAVAVAVVILFSGSSVAGAYPSLPHIETIVDGMARSGNTFAILEIVNDPADAKIGYFIGGQEPGIAGSWERDIANTTTYPDTAARTNYVATVKAALEDSGYMSATAGVTTDPITWIGDYAERLPWETEVPGMRSLQLDSYVENSAVPGTMTSVAAGSGSYNASYQYVPNTNGEVMLDVRKLEFTGSNGTYYFNTVEFAQIYFDNDPDSENFGLPYYEYSPDGRVYITAGTPLYVEGTAGEYIWDRDLSLDLLGGLEAGVDYFAVSDFGEAMVYADVSPSDQNNYYMVSDPAGAGSDDNFIVRDIGARPLGARFVRTPEYYIYVGAGNGTFNYSSTPAGSNLRIQYNTIYYSGGFVNNNWFLRYVLDRSAGDGRLAGNIRVTVATAAAVTQSQITNADLIVLAGGTALSEARALDIYNVSTGTEATGGYTPVMFNHSLNNDGGIIQRLVRSLASKPENTTTVAALPAGTTAVSAQYGVNFNIFWAEDIYNLRRIYTPYNAPGGRLDPVRAEIDNENRLRLVNNYAQADWLPEEVSNATAIRYIINFGNQRKLHRWDRINVLEIQGGQTYTSGTAWNSDLTEAKVRSYIGDTLNQINITITRMTTYEFIGRIEDLNKTYHMIYIGGVARGMNPTTTPNGTSRYNDSSMNGLVYTNIGDRYTTNSDATNTGLALNGHVVGDNQVFRLSGNDISPPKMQDIIDFALAGYPVIIDNELINSPGTASEAINPNRVDNSSYMFETLAEILPLRNVYSVASAVSNPEDVNFYLNLSKPTLRVTNYPTSYVMNAAGVMNSNSSGSNFNFTFTIDNPAEPEPLITTYDVELFLELNGDGRYDDSERQNDIVVRRGGSVLGRSGGVYRLSAGVEYTVTKTMPTGAVGLFDWKLEISKNDTPRKNIRDSQTGLTRIAPGPGQKTEINILQIASSLIRDNADFDYKGYQQRTNFEWQQRELTSTAQINLTRGRLGNATTGYTQGVAAANEYLRGKNNGPYYEGIYGKLIADVDDFDIKIYTVYAEEINDVATLQAAINGRPNGARTAVGRYLSEQPINPADDNSPPIAVESGTQPGVTVLPQNYTIAGGVSLDQILDAFDMLIIGFDDSYGNLTRSAAEAIASYINSGKSTLFAHDAVTYFANDNVSGAYGFESAFILRGVTSLDRYGISSEFNNILRNGNSLPYSATQELLSSGYSVAWTPRQGRTTTLRDVHGYNSHVLKWFAGTNTYSTFMGTTSGENWSQGANGAIGRRTTRVTQLNHGKITTYPYDVNLVNFSTPATFNSTRNTARDVGETHGQWYTVNMNSDNIVVWYCLSSNNYIHNDATNAYYIYNSGNVTYTGAGHSMNQGVTTGRNTQQGSAHPFGISGLTNQYNTNGSHTTQAASTDWVITQGIRFEAQLFVNTMIAAYRAGAENPNITITDNNNVEVNFRLLPADGDLLATGRAADQNRRVNFTISDGNLNANKRIFVSMTFTPRDVIASNPGGPLTCPYPSPHTPDNHICVPVIKIEPEAMPTIRVQGTNAEVANGNLQGGVSYWFYLPDPVIEMLNTTDAAGNYTAPPVTIRLEAETRNIPVPSGRRLTDYADLRIRRLELFNLS